MLSRYQIHWNYNSIIKKIEESWCCNQLSSIVVRAILLQTLVFKMIKKICLLDLYSKVSIWLLYMAHFMYYKLEIWGRIKMIIVLHIVWIYVYIVLVATVLIRRRTLYIKGFIGICEMNILILDFKYLVMLYLKSNIHNKSIC